MLSSGSTSHKPIVSHFLHGMVIGVFVSLSGCSLFQSRKDNIPEYDRAKNAIEGYEDKDGNWVRPEGRRAEKKKNTALSAASKYIPGLGEKPVDKIKARELKLKADALFDEAKLATDDERRKKFREAAKTYQESAKNWTSSAHEQDMLMMAGESLFFAEDYPKCEQQYARLLKEYPTTTYQDAIDARRMEIAMYWLQYNQVAPKPIFAINIMDNKRPWSDTGGHGRRTLEDIRLTNPTGKAGDDATMRLAETHFKNGNFQDAADEYEALRLGYPDSPHQFDAHFLGLKAVLETYEGPERNGAALEKADKLLRQIERQFPAQAEQEKEFLNRAALEIQYKKAERLWTQAEYRMNKKENASAKIYLQQVIDEFGDTPFAEKAKASMEEIQDKPPEPPEHFQWLIKMFPERNSAKPLKSKR